MMEALPLDFSSTLTLSDEVAAYEALWSEKGATFKTIADKFRNYQGQTPSHLVSVETIVQLKDEMANIKQHIGDFGVRMHGTSNYPDQLRDAKHPVEVIYFQGDWELTDTPCVAVVGSRKVSDDGKKRTCKLVKHLVQDDYTIVSGLAAGVDTAAHTTAIECGGKTIAVIGTPLNQVYPKTNMALQEKIRNDYLLISQVPFIRYASQDFRANRLFFPERNITMSALSLATIIVEASDTLGTLHQAKAALQQGRKLLILDSCFQNKNIEWPHKFAEKGAARIKDYDQIKEIMDSVKACKA